MKYVYVVGYRNDVWSTDLIMLHVFATEEAAIEAVWKYRADDSKDAHRYVYERTPVE